MDKNEASFLSRIPDSVKIAVLRWWLIGAIYFMCGMGLGLTGLSGAILLGIAVAVANMFLFHPVIYSMFDVERNGKIINKKYYERTIIEGAFVKLAEAFKCILCSIFTLFVYGTINLVINSLFDYSSDTQKFGVEPITFGIFFLIAYLIITAISNYIYKVKENKENKEIKEKSSEK
ncbi:MAG: hypothetical protein R3Y60_04915 [bacterium]